MKPTKELLFVFFFFLFILPLTAQEVDKSFLSIDRIFHSSDFRSERFGPARFIEDGKYYTTLEPSKEIPGSRDI